MFDIESHEFVGIQSGEGATYWRNVIHAVRDRRIPRKHGHFCDAPGVEDARMAVLALRCFLRHDSPPSAVILVRDSDGKPKERRGGLEQAETEFSWPFDIAIGVAHANRECWVLTAFRPQNKAEIAELAKQKKRLGFDPTARSERLDAKNDNAKKSAKFVLNCLLEATTGADVNEREEQCWQNANVDDLKLRGRENGLAAFLQEIETQLVR